MVMKSLRFWIKLDKNYDVLLWKDDILLQLRYVLEQEMKHMSKTLLKHSKITETHSLEWLIVFKKWCQQQNDEDANIPMN